MAPHLLFEQAALRSEGSWADLAGVPGTLGFPLAGYRTGYVAKVHHDYDAPSRDQKFGQIYIELEWKKFGYFPTMELVQSEGPRLDGACQKTED